MIRWKYCYCSNTCCCCCCDKKQLTLLRSKNTSKNNEDDNTNGYKINTVSKKKEVNTTNHCQPNAEPRRCAHEYHLRNPTQRDSPWMLWNLFLWKQIHYQSPDFNQLMNGVLGRVWYSKCKQ